MLAYLPVKMKTGFNILMHLSLFGAPWAARSCLSGESIAVKRPLDNWRGKLAVGSNRKLWKAGMHDTRWR